ncbi:zinc finger BED domain-containing protein RICESLEEPER 1-like [Mercurialis annua]|uniref:zinc finger BED domain-containing protein RICESLEEPER 1-like n=1 Tax=Mercurialis annua TaxID=3986 RepID=UPI00215F1072|nr:zinc finger BED domain-containing protein RICESLEEPER 1-like [Mercurialis annua]XP_050236368.1 zinc finger BED domain-containing protein RICESLEEPER 1-like [Mercurialis annua]
MVVTAHFVDANCNLQKRTLSFCDVPPPHTGVNICDALHKCLIEWEIEDKVWSVTVDNAAYNDVAIRMLKENLSYKNQLPIDGKLFHVRCCAHILNLLVHDGMSEIGNIIKDVRDSVKHIVNVESRLITFGEIVKQLKLSSKQLILDCCTRWNATYFMLSAALEFKDVFPRYQRRDPIYYSLPSDEDWAKIQEVCSFLEEFNEVTNIISGSEYPTSNLFLYELYNIKKLLDDKYNTEGGFMKAMVGKMKDKFDKYWGDCNLLISMGAVMDPRNKMKIIDYCFPLVYSRDDCIKHVAIIKESLNKLYNEYLETYRHNTIKVVETRRDCSSTTTIGKGKNRGREKFYNYVRSVETVNERIKSELDIYFEEGCHMWDDESNFDVLGWWKMNSLKYKVLSKMVCDLLSIPITSVASESAFSAGGRVIDQYRASLGTDAVQVLL